MAENIVDTTVQAQNEKIRQLEERLDRLERESSSGTSPGMPNLMDVVDRLFPKNVREHMRAARREQLLAVRALIDDMLEGMDEGATPGNKRRRIDVE